jgi:hypothetical protein
MSLSTFVSGAATLTGPSVQYSGFPSTLQAAQTANFLTLSTITVLDNYTTPTSWQGFYLNSSNTITINNGFFNNSRTIYTLSTIQNQSGIQTGSAAFQFYYDTTLGIPSISTLSISFSSITTYQVSGVYVLYGTPSFNINTTLSNMGNYFYSSPLLTFVNTIGSVANLGSQTNLTGITAGYDAVLGQLSSMVSISSFINSASLVNQFTSSISLNLSANNITGVTSVTGASSIKCIVDGPSYAAVSGQPGSIQILLSNGTSALGYRVWSAPVQSNNVPYFTTNASTVTYSQIQYNNNWDISQISSSTSLVGGVLDPSTEVQVFNGAFRSKGTSTITYGYMDYRDFYYTNTVQNGVNYSGISGTGYRYATYVWYAASNTVTLYNKLSFTLNNITPLPTITGGSALVGGTKILLFYRIENSNSLLANNVNFPTTCWIDGNGLGSTSLQASGTNFYQYPSNNGTLAGVNGPAGGVVNSGGNTTFNVIVPGTFLASNSNVIRIYCRVGLPMNVDFSFTSISASLRI